MTCNWNHAAMFRLRLYTLSFPTWSLMVLKSYKIFGPVYQHFGNISNINNRLHTKIHGVQQTEPAPAVLPENSPMMGNWSTIFSDFNLYISIWVFFFYIVLAIQKENRTQFCLLFLPANAIVKKLWEYDHCQGIFVYVVVTALFKTACTLSF